MADRARLVGINHVALEVGDLDEALALYGRLFEFELRGRVPGMAFIDMGDQFLAVAESAEPRHPDSHRHFGLVVDEPEAVRGAVAREGLEELPSKGSGLGFRDPWGNRFEIVEYSEVQFERTTGVKRALGIEGLEKSESARREIAEKRLA
jgi:catechol 2,3-dioxygenase-like lactoylglutathione lyase family enzyme